MGESQAKTASGSRAEAQKRHTLSTLLILVAEPLGLELIRVGENLRVVVKRMYRNRYDLAFFELYPFVFVVATRHSIQSDSGRVHSETFIDYHVQILHFVHRLIVDLTILTEIIYIIISSMLCYKIPGLLHVSPTLYRSLRWLYLALLCE